MSFAVKAESNIDDVIAMWQKAAPRDHFLEVINNTPYAVYLQHRVGYWVMNDETAKAFVYSEIVKVVNEANQRGVLVSDSAIVDALERAADRIVDAYQAVIGSKGSRGQAMLPPRPMHPGNWADDTVTLVRGYLTYVDRNPVKRHPYTLRRAA